MQEKRGDKNDSWRGRGDEKMQYNMSRVQNRKKRRKIPQGSRARRQAKNRKGTTKGLSEDSKGSGLDWAKVPG